VEQLNSTTKVNRKLAPAFASMVALIAAIMLANPIATVNAQENQTQGNQTNQTNIDVDTIIKALQNAYPQVEFGEDDKKFVEGLKDIKDAKELARLMIAEQLIHDLNALKALKE
jgi:Holliday junction resolvase RusA-like endonuclease